MKIILLKQQRNLGKVGEIVTVKGGYGRNFLLPQKIAARATPENIKNLEKQKSELEKQNKEALKAAEILAKKIENKHFTFIKQCADDGRLFGSVNAKEIAFRIAEELKVEVCHSSIFLPHPIKNLGVFEVKISLHPELECEVLANVGRSESEATIALKEYKAGSKKEETPEEVVVEAAAAPAVEEEAPTEAPALEAAVSEEDSE